MRGLADRLDTLAREATGSVEILAPELAVRARRRHRMRVGAGAVAVAACVAAVSLYGTSQSGRARVVKVATPSGTATAPTAQQGAQPPATAVWAELARVAKTTAAQYGDASPGTAEAVATSLAAFETAVYGGSAPLRDAFTGVYFVQMTGQFTCTICLGPHGPPRTWTVLTVAVDQHTLDATRTVLTAKPADLARLGQVYRLDLAAQATPTTSSPVPSGAVYAGPVTLWTNYPGTGVSLTPPPAGLTPGVSWQTAAENCFKAGGICSQGVGVTVSLAVGTDTNSGDVGPNGSITPAMNHTLVYVVAQSNGPCASAGPPGGSTSSRLAASCTSLDFFDAQSGKSVAAMSGPGLWDPSRPPPAGQ
jgi:hypothetical protein